MSDQMSVPLGAPSPPDGLDSHARQEWERIVPVLIAARVLTEADRALLATYCAAVSQWTAAQAALEKNGLTFETPQGYIAQRPEIAIANAAAKTIERVSTHFGLSPSARTRVKAGSDIPQTNQFSANGQPGTRSKK